MLNEGEVGRNETRTEESQREAETDSQTETAQSLGTLHAQPLLSSLLSLGSPYEYRDDFLHTRAQGDRR